MLQLDNILHKTETKIRWCVKGLFCKELQLRNKLTFSTNDQIDNERRFGPGQNARTR